MPIKLSISGIRGKFYELTPDRIVQLVRAFSTYIGGGKVIIGTIVDKPVNRIKKMVKK